MAGWDFDTTTGKLTLLAIGLWLFMSWEVKKALGFPTGFQHPDFVPKVLGWLLAAAATILLIVIPTPEHDAEWLRALAYIIIVAFSFGTLSIGVRFAW